MNRALVYSLALALGVASYAGPAAAQTDPDIRNLRPAVMLLVDTSGSMERMQGGAAARVPMCAGSTAGTNERNRWTTVLEALTGRWPDTDYYCTAVSRSTLPTTSPDYNYYLDYHRPPITVTQLNTGALDVYADRIKFGLMTFDATYTYNDTHPLLVSASMFDTREAIGDNIGISGGFSYGETRDFMYPGCGTTFTVDSGARNTLSTQGGRLVPVATADADIAVTNATIQAELLATRPFGGTPTAALLDDLRHYINNDPSVTAADPFAGCRQRYAVLLTDGQPDSDFRDPTRFNCDGAGGVCPYDEPHLIARNLCQYTGTECGSGDLDGIYVVALDVNDPTALGVLDAIAVEGGTQEAIRVRSTPCTSAEAAADPVGCRQLEDALSLVFDQTANGNTTRTRPSFATGSSTFTSGTSPTQLEFNAGFVVGESANWRGVLERTQFQCNSSDVPVAEPVGDRVRFDIELNRRDPNTRRLLTVVTPSAADMSGNLVGTEATSVPLGAGSLPGTVSGLSLGDFDDAIPHAHFGIAGGSPSARDARRTRIVDWVWGRTADRHAPCAEDPSNEEPCPSRMSDIYHSSPVTVGPPRLDIADESYNLFRRLPGVANRPTVVYVGTNDGVLHAFAAEDFDDGSGNTLDAGEEIFGFIPPILVEKLEAATASHQIMLDGTPIVRDVFYRRLPTDNPDGSIYHTVLVMGFRAGAPGYFALDVTDPFNPEFLWQFVGEQSPGGGPGGGGPGGGGPGGGGPGGGVTPMGNSYGAPAIGQVLVDIGGTLQERAIALLPGGAGDEDADRRRTTGPVGCPSQGVGQPPVTQGTTNARSRQKCWTNTGRVLQWVDIVTGEVIQTFDHTTFNAPLTGGVALYPGGVGTSSERAFFTDADGVMWTADFTSRNPATWDVRPFHDIFHDALARVGQPAYNPPLVTSNLDGEVVVLQATGDIDALDSAAENRVVSLTEHVTFSGGGTPTYTTELNWEIRLQAGEQVTGPLELFEGTVYFGSFNSNAAGADACLFGDGAVWAVDYLAAGSSAPSGYTDPLSAFPEPRFESTPGTGLFTEHFQPRITNEVVLGVGVTQRPTCVTGTDEFDPYIGTRYRVNNTGGGAFVLRAQLSGRNARDADDGAIRTLEQALPAPQSFTTVSGFAGQVDY